MTGIFFPLVSIFIDLLIICLFFFKKKVHNHETKIYGFLLLINFFECLFDVFGITYIHKGGLMWVFSLSQKLDMILIAVWVSFLFDYIVYVTFNDEKLFQKNKNVNLLILLFVSILVLVCPNVPIVQNNMVDSSGLAPTIAYLAVICWAVGIVFCIVKSIVKDKNNLKNKKYIPLYILVVLAGFGLLLRSMFPEIVFEPFVMSYVLLLMYFTIENPDLKVISQLELAREQADRANRAKTEFLSSMSHEIRTPLNAIVGFSNCISDAKSLDEAKENAKDIVMASDTLLDIVNGILDISKIEAGKLEIVNSSYNPFEKLMELATLMRGKIEEKGIDFQVNIAQDLPKTLIGDHANLKKVVLNILSNAYKYTDKGFINYSVQCVNKSDVCRLIISVEDSGRGIKKENIDKLFTKFQRLDEDRNTTIEGTGLGLAITKQLVELMGGSVIVHTIYGQGSKFTITLDQKIDYENKTLQSKSYDYFSDNKFDLNGRKILIVDDNQLNLKVASKLLSKFGANIELCDSGFACCDNIISGNYYDLILMDIMMPRMSGDETLNRLKSIQGFNTPVVALTADAINGMREKYILLGFDDYLAKPIKVEEMKKVLTKIFNKESTREKVDFGSLPSSFYEIGNTDKLDITQPIVVDSDLVEVIDDDSDIYPNKIEENANLNNDNIEVIDSLDDTDNSCQKDFTDWVEYLKDNGVDVEHGLSLLGDMEMYNDTLRDFLSEIDEKHKQIIDYKDKNDMKNYAILVHSLKSDSKYLGFMNLADIAYQHELKSKENDSDFVNNNFQKLENELNKILDIAREYLKHI